MEKKELLDHLEYALKQVLCNGLDGIDKAAMESSIEMFIAEEVTQYTPEELLEKFHTPEMSIKLFTDYLAQKGALDEIKGNTVH